MFWEYGLTVSSIDQLLERDPPATLEEILAEPDILQELKTNNEKLVTFLTEPAHFARIFELLVIDSADNCARICKEILACGAPCIDSCVFDDKNNIIKLYHVFRRGILQIGKTTEIDQNEQSTKPTTTESEKTENIDQNLIIPSPAGLRRAVAVFEHLVQFRAHELLAILLSENFSIFSDLFDLMHFQPVAELIVKLVTCRTEEGSRHKSFARLFLEENHSQSLLNAIIEKDIDTKKGALFVIMELFRWVRYDISNGDSDVFEYEIMNSLQKDEMVEKLIKYVVQEGEIEQKWPAVAVLCIVFNLQRTGDIYGDEFISPSNIPVVSMNLSKKKFSSYIEYIEPLFKLLKNSVTSSKNKMGKFRIFLLELIVSLSLYNNEDLSKEISRLEIPTYLLNLFDDFPENNLAHNLIELCITCVLMGYRWKTYNGAHLYIDNNLVLSLFQTELFVKKLIELSHSKKNYIGHVRQIQRTFRLSATESYHKTIISEIKDGFSDELKKLIEEADEELSRIDKIEAIDSRFLKVMTDDFDSSSFVNESHGANITLEKSVDYFRNEKASIFPEDVAENFENQMSLDINISGIDDKFEEMKIPKIELDVNQEFIDSTLSKVKDIAECQIKIDDLSENNDKNMPHSSSIDIKVTTEDNEPKNFNNKISDSEIIKDSLNAISDRCATSSPLVGEFQKLSLEENTFEDDNSNND